MLRDWAKRGRPAALAMLALALVWRAADPGGVLEHGRTALFELYQRLHPRQRPADRPVVVVDAEAAALGVLTDNLTQAGAVRVILDTDLPGGMLYAAPFEPDALIPARDVVDGTFDPDRVAGRVVLVGSSAETMPTALDRAVPAVEIQAQWIESGGHGLTRPAAGWIEAGAAVLAGLAVMASAWSLPLLAGGLVWLSWWQFVSAQRVYDPLFPLLTATLVWMALTLGRRHARHHQGDEAQDSGAVEQATPGAEIIEPAEVAGQPQRQREMQEH